MAILYDAQVCACARTKIIMGPPNPSQSPHPTLHTSFGRCGVGYATVSGCVGFGRCVGGPPAAEVLSGA